MKDREPTVRSRELGERLRQAMEYAGYNGTQIAAELGWSAGRVSRLLAGKRGGSDYAVSAFLAVCRVTGTEREYLMDLSTDHHHPGWLIHHGPVVPNQIPVLLNHETKATTITEYQPTLIPDLLQTPDYTRALLSHSANIPHKEIDDRIHARGARQKLLNRPRAPICTFFLHEFALRIPIGGPAVMTDQLHHLLHTTAHPNVTLRVIPTHLGTHPAVTTRHFTLMDIPDFKPIIHLEAETTSLILETPTEIDTYRNILTHLDKTALNKETSTEFIGNMTLEFSG